MGIEAGANDFLNKPWISGFDPARRQCCLHKRLFDQLQIERQRSERLLLNTYLSLSRTHEKRENIATSTRKSLCSLPTW